MLWGASSSSPAVHTALGASGCSYRWISDRLLHCLHCRVLGFPSPESVCNSIGILLIIGSTTQQWHYCLLLLHQVQRYFPVSWSSPVCVIAKHFIVLSMYKSICQSWHFFESVRCREQVFYSSHCDNVKICLPFPIFCLHQAVGVSKGCTLNSASSPSRLPFFLFKLLSCTTEAW